jgi:hypothetical protein
VPIPKNELARKKLRSKESLNIGISIAFSISTNSKSNELNAKVMNENDLKKEKITFTRR